MIDRSEKLLSFRRFLTPLHGITFAALRNHAQNHKPLSRKIAGAARYYVRFYDNIDWDLHANGERELLRRLATIGVEQVFDVGANRGDWTEAALELLLRARVHAFEIAPPTFAKLRERYEHDTRVVLNGVGLAATAGTTTIDYYADQEDGTSMILGMALARYEPKPLIATIRTGDDYCLEHAIERIHILKTDTEGADHLVLQGFSSMLESQRIDVIQFEYANANAYSGSLLRDHYEFLEQRGYRMGKLYPRGVRFGPYDSRSEDFQYANYVAVRSCRDDLIARVRYA